MNEDFLQLGWKNNLFALAQATLVDGSELKVIDKGVHNHLSGPDFLQAKIRINQTLWAGNIEFHVKSSDWIKHKHSEDPVYESVILHIVWEYDTEILNQDGSPIPTLELKNYVSHAQINRYLSLIQSLTEIPCEQSIRNIDSLTVHQMIQRAVVNRTERKSERIRSYLETSSNDWNYAFYKTLFRNFGFKTNQHAFESIIDRLPLKSFDLLKDKPLACEALLLGTSGLLENIKEPDDYILSLQNEFEFLQHKHKITPISPTLWKFGRIRPHNFPYIRLAQLASILNRNTHLFSKVLESEGVEQLIKLFQTNISNYWRDHLKPGMETDFKNSDLSKDAIDLIIINTCVPMVFFYGRETGNQEYSEKALQWLEAVKPEKNKIISYWKSTGIKAANCFESQGLIELKEIYCNPKRCLECGIGFKILKG